MRHCELLDVATLSQDHEWWALYESSFPSCEREPRTAILRSVGSGRAIALRAVLHEGTVGLGVAYLLKGMPFVFVGYVAVSPDVRQHGLGAELIDDMFAFGTLRLRRMGRECRGMVLEVEDPALATSPEALTERLKRYRFFERQGARRLPTPYWQPAIDGEAAIPLSLLVIDRSPSSSLRAAEIRDLIAAMYFEKYGPINGIDSSTLMALMADLPSIAYLPLPHGTGLAS